MDGQNLCKCSLSVLLSADASNSDQWWLTIFPPCQLLDVIYERSIIALCKFAEHQEKETKIQRTQARVPPPWHGLIVGRCCGGQSITLRTVVVYVPQHNCYTGLTRYIRYTRLGRGSSWWGGKGESSNTRSRSREASRRTAVSTTALPIHILEDEARACSRTKD